MRVFTGGHSYPSPTIPSSRSLFHNTITALAISPNGYQIASAGWDGEIVVWELSSGKIIKRLGHISLSTSKPPTSATIDVQRHTGPVQTLCFSRGGEALVSGGADGSIIVWNMQKLSNGTSSAADILCSVRTKKTPVIKTL